MYTKITAFVTSRWHLSAQIVRFVISGGASALTQLILLYVFTQFFGIWYLFSLILAFAISLGVSFTLQKFWTFEDTETSGMHLQIPSYLAVTLTNLAVNAALLYIAVEFLKLWYLFAQVLIEGIIAISSFFIYKFVIFRRRESKS